MTDNDKLHAVFANGAEYRVFDERYCCTCKKYVPWEIATESNPVCPIEDAISHAMFDESMFPHEFIKREAANTLPHCTEWEAE